MVQPASPHLFVYGTLLVPAVLEAVTCRSFAASPAVLAGYRRCRVRGKVFPTLLPDAEASVEGLVIRDVDAASWHLLDRYEGDLYDRVAVTVRRADGRAAAAHVYVANAKGRALAEPAPWSLETFVARDLAAYLDGIDA